MQRGEFTNDMKRSLPQMAPTTLIQTVFNRTSPPRPTVLGCGNIGDEKLKRSIDLTFGVLIAILNLAEIIMIAKIKRKKKIYEVVLLSLSVSDCMFGLSNVFVSVPHIASICRFQDLVETTYTLYVFFILTSIFHLLFITLDRLIAILKPFKHRTCLSRKRFYMYLAILWILAVMISALLKILDEFTNTFEKDAIRATMPMQTTRTTPIRNLRIYRTRRSSPPRPLSHSPRLPPGPKSNTFKTDMQFTLSVIIIIADVIMISSYSLIIYITTCKTKKVSSAQKQSNKLPAICIAIAATFVMFTLPYAVARFVIGAATFWPNLMLVLSSGVNSIVYFFRIKISKLCQNKRKKERMFNSDTETVSVSLTTLT